MKTRLICILSFLCCVQLMSAQFTFDGKRPFYDKQSTIMLLTIPEEMFGKGHTFNFVPDDTIAWVGMGGYEITDKMSISNISGDAVYTFVYRIKNTSSYRSAKLRFTHLPVVNLVGNIDEDYSVGEVLMQVPEDTITRRWKAKMKWAGSSTNRPWYVKHNYHIKFQDDNGEKMELSFNGLRKDNHWRMDGGVIDFLRIRNKVSHGIWADMGNKPYYADAQPNAKSYIRGFYVEYFDNNRYRGLSNFAEYLDRKQMKLKKYDDAAGEFHGMLWKAKEASWQTLFVADSTYTNLEDRWGEFELEYPDLEDASPTDYHVLSDAIDFVATSSDEEFRQQVGEYFDLPILVDYYVFINVLLATDNTCKNILWGCYDEAVDKKLTLAVWDLDATMGQYWNNADGNYHGQIVSPENDLNDVSELVNNRLFIRLMEWPKFRQQIYNRYWQLRESILTPDSLINRFWMDYEVLRHAGVLSRELSIFNRGTDLSGRELNFDNELEYVSDWLIRRIEYLDNNLFAIHRGDVDRDGEVSINDLNALIDLLLSGIQSDVQYLYADVDEDGEASINDVNTLIDILLRK